MIAPIKVCVLMDIAIVSLATMELIASIIYTPMICHTV